MEGAPALVSLTRAVVIGNLLVRTAPPQNAEDISTTASESHSSSRKIRSILWAYQNAKRACAKGHLRSGGLLLVGRRAGQGADGLLHRVLRFAGCGSLWQRQGAACTR